MNLIKKEALIGYTGFIGSTLSRTHIFDDYFRSTNIEKIKGEKYKLVICAGAPAEKWKANLYPKKDLDNIDHLIRALENVSVERFILISTIDVFHNPANVDEKTNISVLELEPYGLHRRKLELFVKENFQNSLIIRLPGVIGTGLKKNIIFDLLNQKSIEKIDSRNIYQFYPVDFLWQDINFAIEKKIKLIHLSSEPISVRDICLKCLGKDFLNHLNKKSVFYDFRSIYAKERIGKSHYYYSQKEVINAIKKYFSTEKLTS